ncbi:MAG: DNA-3-methyladenine glycosylase [Candidatus Bathyarchaeota archaeon]|jgi:DNA-3-methyladenine glycosylase
MERIPPRVLQFSFYSRDPAAVARDLLGKRLVRRFDGALMEGIVVETEAYYGFKDPASRAFRGMKGYNRLMWGEPARVFIYNVHRYWMFNIVAHIPNGIGAVLIRAIEPTKGIEVMLRNRPVEELKNLTSGPGKLTLAMGIDKNIHGSSVTDPDGEVFILDADLDIELGTSHRIGVTRDLDRDLRFYMKGNPFVSR